MGGSRLFSTKVQPGGLLRALGYICGLVTLIGFGGDWWWFSDIVSSFRIQYAGGTALVTVAALASREWRLAFFLFIGTAINLAMVISFQGAARPMTGTQPVVLRVMYTNVESSNKEYELVREAIREAQPDVVVLAEITPLWLDQIAGLRTLYPHVLAETREDCFGIVLMSKIPLRNPEIIHFGKAGVPSVHAAVEISNQWVSLVGTHPVPPKTKEHMQWRDDQLLELGRLLTQRRAAGGAAILLGDLNATPWSGVVRRLRRENGLTDSAAGYGLQTTWPVQVPLLRIPIDQCLFSKELTVVNYRRGPDVGSDHFPVIVDLVLAGRAR